MSQRYHPHAGIKEKSTREPLGCTSDVKESTQTLFFFASVLWTLPLVANPAKSKYSCPRALSG